jgi:cysteine-rich repeat protein
MKTTLPMIRLLSLGLCAAALAACNNDGSDTGAEAGNTEGSTSDSSTGNASQTTKTSATDGTDTVTDSGVTDSGVTDSGVTDSGATDSGATDTDPTGTTADISATDTDPGTTTGGAVCGDGVKEGKEECDDGNQDPGDGCEPGCVVTAECGNGVVETGELCDDGNTEDGDECSADCSMVTVKAVCGNGMVEDVEECDDGNQDAGDGCENDCTISLPVCGNAKVEGAEACDDGNDVNGGPGDFCKNDCTVFVPASCNAPPAKDYIVCDTGLETANKNDKTIAHKAMGICSDQANNSVVLSPGSFSFTSTNNAAWQVAKGFGTYQDPKNPGKLLYSPREGDTFLMVSTGVIKAPNNQGVVIETNNSQGGNGDNGNDDGNALPAPFQSKKGSANGAGNTPFQNCDGVNDCSDTLAAQWQLGGSNPNDKLWFTFKTKVPEGTFGYRFDFVFCSSEWPSWVNTGYNDLLISWQTDPSADDPNADPPVDPYTGNVTFIPNPNDPAKGLPLTITALDPYFKGPGYSGNEPQLAGTGFEGNACTDWFTAKGGVQPGAEVTIGFFIADMSDSILATMAILDNFRWDCEGCVPSEVDDCGVQQPQ